MAANLSGMFNQLNQAIGQNPIAGATGTKLLDRASQGLGGALAGALGSENPYGFMTQGGKNLQGQRDMAGLDLSTHEGLAAASEIQGKLGSTQNQLAFAKAAQTERQAAAALKQKQELRESLAKRAHELGLAGLAEGIATGGADLEDAAEKVREAEKVDLLTTRGLPARKHLAKNVGISLDEFDDAGLGSVTNEEFKAYIEGQTGKTKPFTDAKGNIVSLRESKYGRIWDEATQSWKNPSELGVQPAPQIQKVHNVSNKMVDELAMQGVENFTDLHGKANEAVLMLDNINRNLPLLDEMPTGFGAEVSVFVRKVATALGDNPDNAAANAEVYMSEAGLRTAQAIQNFGSGTGLSDADRDFAKGMAAGNITVDGEAIKRILKIQKEVAQKTIDNYHETKSSIKTTLGAEEGKVLDMYILRDPQSVPEVPKAKAEPDVVEWVRDANGNLVRK